MRHPNKYLKYPIDLSHNDVKCRFTMLHEGLLAREKRRAHQSQCKFHFSTFDVIMKKVYKEKI